MGKGRRNVDSDETLVGTKRDDSIYGYGGNDVISGGLGGDYLRGGEGDDYLYGNTAQDPDGGDLARDILLGEAGNDHLFGGAGADSLNGGVGTDTLTGGSGADTFYGNRDQLNGDTITDFDQAAGDEIHFSYSPAYTFVGDTVSGAFEGGRGEMTLAYDAEANVTTLNLYDDDGDLVPDYTVLLVGQITSATGIFFEFG